MVTTALMENGHFWTAGNKRPRNQSSPDFAQVITSVSLMYVQILVAIGCRGISRPMREVLHFCPYLTHYPSIPSFLPFFSCARPQVEHLNRYWWLMAQTTRLDTRKCLLGMRMMKKYIKGVYDPQNRRFFRPSREITATTLMINNFQTVQLSQLLIIMTSRKSCVIFLNLQKYLAHSAPWRRYSNQFTDVRCFQLLFRVKLDPKQTGISIWQLGKYSRHAPAS